MRQSWVRSLGREDPLEKEMATPTSILAWRIPWTEEPGSYSPRGCKESDTTEATEHALMLEEKKEKKEAIRLSDISRLGR